MSSERYLLDTNVVSELRKTRPAAPVLRFFQRLSRTQAFISTLTVGELRKGAALFSKKNLPGGQQLSEWIDGLEANFADRILPVDMPVARIWGELSAERSRAVVDTLIAATAIHHRLTLVTRNVRDVEDTPAQLHNPWVSPDLPAGGSGDARVEIS